MHIRDDHERGIIIIDGLEIKGWVDERACPSCGHDRVYHMDRDAFFCPACNLWLEAACGDLNCSFCSGRPDRPLPVTPAA